MSAIKNNSFGNNLFKLGVFKRNKTPLKGNLRLQIFMQSLVARNKRMPISPMQLEALFFRFFKQLDDGSSP